MSTHEQHTPRHAADSKWQEPSRLRKVIGKVIGKKPLPGKEYNERALTTAAAVALGVSAVLCYGVAEVNGLASRAQETNSSTAESSTTTEINTDPMNLQRDVVETIKTQGYDPTEITIVWPDFAAEHQGQDPRTASYAKETYKVSIKNGTATVTRVK